MTSEEEGESFKRLRESKRTIQDLVVDWFENNHLPLVPYTDPRNDDTLPLNSFGW